MKKVFLLLSSVALLASANAQEEASATSAKLTQTSSSDSYKAEAGDKTLEFTFSSPFNAGTQFALPQGGELRFRSFQSESFALRVGVNVNYNTTGANAQTVSKFDEDGNVTEQTELYNAAVTRNLTVNFTPGFEKHFEGTEKLSPFVGAIANIGYTKNTQIQRQAIDGDNAATNNDDGFSKIVKQKTRNGALNLGLSGVAGFDYYFTKKLYIGAEMSFGFAVNSPFKAKVTNDSEDFYGKPGESVRNAKSTLRLAPAVNGNFRLGFAF